MILQKQKTRVHLLLAEKVPQNHLPTTFCLLMLTVRVYILPTLLPVLEQKIFQAPQQQVICKLLRKTILLGTKQAGLCIRIQTIQVDIIFLWDINLVALIRVVSIMYFLDLNQVTVIFLVYTTPIWGLNQDTVARAEITIHLLVINPVKQIPVEVTIHILDTEQALQTQQQEEMFLSEAKPVNILQQELKMCIWEKAQADIQPEVIMFY